MEIKQEWEDYVYEKLNLKNNSTFKTINLNKEVINELLSFIATFKNLKFVFNTNLDNILYDINSHTFTLINLENAKFKKNKLSNDEYYFNFISVYFSICKKSKDYNLINYLKKEIVKYIPIEELYKFHHISNNDLLDLYI